MEGIFKFLGVSSGTSSKGPYYNVEVHGESGSIRLRCNEDVFNKGMRIQFGQDVTLHVTLRMYQGSVLVMADGIEG